MCSARVEKRAQATRESSPPGQMFFPLVQALYDLPRSGADFIHNFHARVGDGGWQRSTEGGVLFWRCLFRGDGGGHDLALVCSYVDDILAATPRSRAGHEVCKQVAGCCKSDAP